MDIRKKLLMTREELERANEYVFSKVLELRQLLEDDKNKKKNKGDA